MSKRKSYPPYLRRRIEAGLCIRCPAASVGQSRPGQLWCGACAERLNEAKAGLVAQRRGDGRCVQCGAGGWSTRCPECREANRDASRRCDQRRRRSAKVRRRDAEQARRDRAKRHERARRLGACERCGDAAKPGRLRCVACTEYAAEQQRLRKRGVRAVAEVSARIPDRASQDRVGNDAIVDAVRRLAPHRIDPWPMRWFYTAVREDVGASVADRSINRAVRQLVRAGEVEIVGRGTKQGEPLYARAARRRAA